MSTTGGRSAPQKRDSDAGGEIAASAPSTSYRWTCSASKSMSALCQKRTFLGYVDGLGDRCSYSKRRATIGSSRDAR